MTTCGIVEAVADLSSFPSTTVREFVSLFFWNMLCYTSESGYLWSYNIDLASLINDLLTT